MVQIYYEITIYILRGIFSFRGFALEPPLGACLLPDPTRGRKPPCNPLSWRGVKYSWGMNMDENKYL
jgi:hypothetical protein